MPDATQPDATPPDDDVWFMVFRSKGRLRAWPLNWKGWASLLGITLAPTALFIAVTQVMAIRSPWVGFGYLVVALPTIFFTLSRLFKAKGRNL